MKEATLSIETDQEMLAKFGGNVTAMTAYVNTLVGQASVIYERDVQVHLKVNVVRPGRRRIPTPRRARGRSSRKSGTGGTRTGRKLPIRERPFIT